MTPPPSTPLRLLVVLPSWVGDAVMATPALRLLRDALPGAFLGGLVRPGIDQLLAGIPTLDEFHVEHARGVMGPKFVAGKIRPRRYDTALLLTNSFSTALVTRIAGIPRRMGYDRDGRGFLLTHKLAPLRSAQRTFAPVSAVTYYWQAAEFVLKECGVAIPREHKPAGPPRSPPRDAGDLGLPLRATMELAISDADTAHAAAVFAHCGIPEGVRPVILNPGGNNGAKRWPAERFAQLADHIARTHAVPILVSGSPGEAELCATIVHACAVAKPFSLPAIAREMRAASGTLGTLKAIIARCSLMVSNDTGPRHIAAALGVRTVSLFGPTDHRWTIIPTRPTAPEVIITADPTLPEDRLSNDHPERCATTRIGLDRVAHAVVAALIAPAESPASSP